MAKDIATRRRNPLKFVLIGVDPSVNETQMAELDDLDSGTSFDLWDHKLAAEMRVLQEIFAEVVERNARVADNGRILDAHGRIVKDYSDVGLPALLEFEMPAGDDYFTLEVNGTRIHQALSDRARTPMQREEPPIMEAQPVAAEATEDDDPNAEWRGIDLELRKDAETDIALEKPKDE